MPEGPFAPFKAPFPQIEGWVYFFMAGVLWSALALFCLARYHRGRLALTPRSAFEKGAAVFILLLALSLAGEIALRVPSYARASTLFADITMITLAALAIWMVLARYEEGINAPEPEEPGVSPSDPCWKVGWKYWAIWLWVPIHILIAAAIAVAMVDEPWRKDGGLERHRFGPNATWRLEMQRQSTRGDGE